MAEKVEMKVPAVRKMAKNFRAISGILKQVSKALQALMSLLKATAFVGMVGGLALERYISLLKPQIDRLAKDTAEISRDLDAAVSAFERGDAEGALRFH
jgi:uncharacterized protein YukE